MGSFYSSCSISGMTLSHQKTSILLLTPNAESFSEHLNMIVCNGGSQAFFSPFGFPIHGVYDDYGHITNIKRDKNVEMLEEYFGVDIDSILKGIGRERDTPKDIKHKEFYQTLGMTYFRTEVLEYLESGWDKYNLDSPNQYTKSEFINNMLKAIDKSSNRISDTKYAELMKKKLDGTITDSDRELMSEFILSSIGSERTYIEAYRGNMFKTLPITSKDFKEHILKQYTMMLKFGYDLGRTLMPSNYGSQENNWVELYKLNDFVNDLLVEDIKGWYDGDGTDGEEAEILRIHQAVVRNKKINSIL